MTLRYAVEEWPKPRGGASTHKLQAGVKVTDTKTGEWVICTKYRSQYQNRDAAIKRLREVVLMDLQTFTAWCQRNDGIGTIWVDTVEVNAAIYETPADMLDAISHRALEDCAEAWGLEDVQSILCMGIARGDVDLVYWDDSHME